MVSVIIPCRNEEQYIRDCLNSVLAFKRPSGIEVEILVMDGRSEDRTREIVGEIAAVCPEVRLLDNPGLIQSCAMNFGVRVGRGAWILRLDAHSKYPADYLERCWEASQRTGAENVGGIFITEPGADSFEARLIQGLTTHRFGVAGFRVGAIEGPADTVPFGFFKRDVFERVGWMDERLVRNQDYEFNRRIIASGGQVWRDPRIRVTYFNLPSLLGFYLKQVRREAPYNAYMWYLAPYSFTPRHAVTGVFALATMAALALIPFSHADVLASGLVLSLYLLLAVGASAQQAVRYRRPSYLLALPGCFFLFHFIHGLGVLGGLLRLLTGTAPVQTIREPWPGAGRFRAWPRPESVTPTEPPG